MTQGAGGEWGGLFWAVGKSAAAEEIATTRVAEWSTITGAL